VVVVKFVDSNDFGTEPGFDRFLSSQKEGGEGTIRELGTKRSRMRNLEKYSPFERVIAFDLSVTSFLITLLSVSIYSRKG
jgi:hypothetical protein